MYMMYYLNTETLVHGICIFGTNTELINYLVI